MEQQRIHRRLVAAGVDIRTSAVLQGHEGDTARLACAYTGRETAIACDAVVTVTYREPNASLVGELRALGLEAEGVGDAWNPGTIAEAVHHGRLYAESFDAPPGDPDATPFRREVIALS